MLHLCCLCARVPVMYNNAIKGRGPSGRGVLWGATRFRTCGSTGARNMAVGARTLSYLAVPQQIGYSGS